MHCHQSLKSKQDITLTVIIVNYNVAYFLEQCLLSVFNSKGIEHFEVFVIDNRSSDGSVAMVQEKFPQVNLIVNQENVGFSKANNQAIRESKSEYVLLLNPDTVLQDDSLVKCLNYLDNHQDVGGLGVRMIDGKGNFLPESKRGIPTPFVALTKIFGLYNLFPNCKLFNRYYAQHLSENETGKVDILVGAFMVMKQDLYNEIGGFDENCFMYSDDIDLSFMALKSGKINYYFHETSVIHYKGESTVKDGLYMKRFREAMQFFYKKHYKSSPLFDFFMKMLTSCCCKK